MFVYEDNGVGGTKELSGLVGWWWWSWLCTGTKLSADQKMVIVVVEAMCSRVS